MALTPNTTNYATAGYPTQSSSQLSSGSTGNSAPAGHRSLVCWKSVAAGLLVSILTYMVLSALGMAIGGFSAAHVIRNGQQGNGLALGATIWLVASALFSLGNGSYFASRVHRTASAWVGTAQGIVIASLFFILLVYGAGTIVGGVARDVVGLAGASAGGAADLTANPAVQSTIQNAIGTSGTLKSDPAVVTQHVAADLLRGDKESAKTYLAYQTGQTPAEVDAKMDKLTQDFEAAAQDAAIKTSKGVADAGLTLFFTFLLGIGFAVLGGMTGARANRKPTWVQTHDLVYDNNSPTLR
jgi:hypothetical protein